MRKAAPWVGLIAFATWTVADRSAEPDRSAPAEASASERFAERAVRPGEDERTASAVAAELRRLSARLDDLEARMATAAEPTSTEPSMDSRPVEPPPHVAELDVEAYNDGLRVEFEREARQEPWARDTEAGLQRLLEGRPWLADGGHDVRCHDSTCRLDLLLAPDASAGDLALELPAVGPELASLRLEVPPSDDAQRAVLYARVDRDRSAR